MHGPYDKPFQLASRRDFDVLAYLNVNFVAVWGTTIIRILLFRVPIQQFFFSKTSFRCLSLSLSEGFSL